MASRRPSSWGALAVAVLLGLLPGVADADPLGDFRQLSQRFARQLDNHRLDTRYLAELLRFAFEVAVVE